MLKLKQLLTLVIMICGFGISRLLNNLIHRSPNVSYSHPPKKLSAMSLLLVFIILNLNLNSVSPASHEVLFPTMCESQWKDLSIRDINCEESSILESSDFAYANPIVSKIPRSPNFPKANGYLCSGQIWSIKCEETWYWSTSIVRTIDTQIISSVECLAAIKSYKEGTLIEPFFDEPNCAWNSINALERKHIIVHEHPVNIDPYEDLYLDPLFLGIGCQKSPCDTIHKDLIWITDEPNNLPCTTDMWMTDIYKVSQDKLLVKSEAMGIRSLKGSCIMKLCNHPGIRFSSGEWWGTYYNHPQQADKIPNCNPNEKISLSHRSTITEKLIVESDLSEYSCYQSLSKIYNKELISLLDFYYIVNKSSGEKMAKRLIQHKHDRRYKIQGRLCHYRFITPQSNPNIQKNPNGLLQIGIDHNSFPVKINVSSYFDVNDPTLNWTVVSMDGITYSPAGLKFPYHENILDLLETILDKPDNLALLNRPEKTIPRLEGGTNNLLKSSTHSNSTNLMTSTLNELSSLGSLISGWFDMTWVRTLIGLVIAFIIIIICFRVFKCFIPNFGHKTHTAISEHASRDNLFP
ncbi:glycoprotein [Marco virus]|uniref:Glycoprotein n=1 Tax=Marco virus TaxID=1158190 RepID=A0A0D3R1F2_9RHAB|nr:glycoprotein [Marco virus]AJR28446.1 glycoprotein [Marco virus]